MSQRRAALLPAASLLQAIVQLNARLQREAAAVTRLGARSAQAIATRKQQWQTCNVNRARGATRIDQRIGQCVRGRVTHCQRIGRCPGDCRSQCNDVCNIFKTCSGKSTCCQTLYNELINVLTNALKLSINALINALIAVSNNTLINLMCLLIHNICCSQRIDQCIVWRICQC